MASLFDRHALNRQLTLSNRVVMAPLTRTRTSAGNARNSLMATYCRQRASAGLNVTSPDTRTPSRSMRALRSTVIQRCHSQRLLALAMLH
jgi:N-ethylmaleimide reductase